MIVCLDVETTGLDPLENEVAQLGFVVLDDRQPGLPEVAAYSCYLRCTLDAFVPAALEVNGLTHNLLGTAPEPGVALGVLAQHWDAQVLGHNVVFDLEFLRMAYRRAGLGYPGWKYRHCTMALANSLQLAGLMPRRSLSLDALASALDVPGRNTATHDALIDARITAEVFRRLIAKVEHYG